MCTVFNPIKYIRIFVPLLLFIVLFSCKGVVSDNNSDNGGYIEIDFPLHKKSVYATVFYIDDNSSIDFLSVQISSLQFNYSYTSDDTLFLNGIIEKYYLSRPYYNFMPSTIHQSGSIQLSVDKKWVLFQSSEIMNASGLFMKILPVRKISTDITPEPTESYNQYPVYPKIIEPHSEYSIFRPASENNDFLSVSRDFRTYDYTTWSDVYGNDKGIFIEIDHQIDSFTFPYKYYLILDNHGIIVSQNSSETVISSPLDPDGTRTVMMYDITRRIIDYTEPHLVNELSHYADEIIEKRLKIIDIYKFIKQ